jgi:hypothetical protein
MRKIEMNVLANGFEVLGAVKPASGQVFEDLSDE